MGAPCAPAYANLYFGIKEMVLFEEFSERLLVYKRFIDDINGTWIPHPDPHRNQELWLSFCQRLNNLCSLTWECSELSSSVNFLDLTVSIIDNKFDFALYSKPLNLYQYLSPLSAHQPGTLLCDDRRSGMEWALCSVQRQSTTHLMHNIMSTINSYT